MNRSVIRFFILFLIFPFTVPAQTAEEIVRQADEMMDYASAYMEARMVNTDRFGAKTIEYTAWAKDHNFLLEFTSDAEYGQKILRTDDRIYHFFPDSETIFTKSKGDSIVGLISYDDVTDESKMLDTYDVSLEGEETVEDVPCYKIFMTVKKGKRVAYPIQIVWFEKETSTPRRVEMFTRSNKPLKTMHIREVQEFEDKKVATDILITDDVRTGVTSEIFIEVVDLKQNIPDRLFTRRELTR
jgi:outer membrane lipoprotein-sorting protein